VAIVTDNLDPENRGRVKLKYPWLSDDHQTHWARIATPMAGGGRGFHFLPEISDEVLVAFEHGDIHKPYVIGCLWNGVDDPVEANSKAVDGGKVNRRSIKTRIGHTLLLDDTSGKGEMSLTTCNGHKVVLDDAGLNIKVKTKLGHEVLLDDAGKQISIKDMTSANSIVISSVDGSITMTCIGNMSLTCLNFTLTALASVTMTAAAGITMTAGMAMTTTVGTAYALTVAGAMSLTSGTATSLSSGSACSITSGAVMALTSGAAMMIVAPVPIVIRTPAIIGPVPVPPPV
jgi:hypothetical protein